MGALDIAWGVLGSNLKKDQRYLTGADDVDEYGGKANVDYGPDPNLNQEHEDWLDGVGDLGPAAGHDREIDRTKGTLRPVGGYTKPGAKGKRHTGSPSRAIAPSGGGSRPTRALAAWRQSQPALNIRPGKKRGRDLQPVVGEPEESSPQLEEFPSDPISGSGVTPDWGESDYERFFDKNRLLRGSIGVVKKTHNCPECGRTKNIGFPCPRCGGGGVPGPRDPNYRHQDDPASIE